MLDNLQMGKVQRQLNGIIGEYEIDLDDYKWELAPIIPYPKTRWCFWITPNRTGKDGKPTRYFHKQTCNDFRARRSAIKRGEYGKNAYYGGCFHYW